MQFTVSTVPIVPFLLAFVALAVLFWAAGISVIWFIFKRGQYEDSPPHGLYVVIALDALLFLAASATYYLRELLF